MGLSNSKQIVKVENDTLTNDTETFIIEKSIYADGSYNICISKIII